MKIENKKLKPLILSNSKTGFYRSNLFQQNVLLKAMTHTSDLEELKKIAKFHSTAEVLRTLDKLAIRKEYHVALAKNEMGIDDITKGISNLAKNSTSDKIKLGAYQTLLKTLGLDKYEVSENQGKNWEELLLKVNEAEKNESRMLGESVNTLKINTPVYDVAVPKMPSSVKTQREEDSASEKSIYE